jgi:hypothetical protein
MAIVRSSGFSPKWKASKDLALSLASDAHGGAAHAMLVEHMTSSRMTEVLIC